MKPKVIWSKVAWFQLRLELLELNVAWLDVDCLKPKVAWF